MRARAVHAALVIAAARLHSFSAAAEAVSNLRPGPSGELPATEPDPSDPPAPLHGATLAYYTDGPAAPCGPGANNASASAEVGLVNRRLNSDDSYTITTTFRCDRSPVSSDHARTTTVAGS